MPLLQQAADYLLYRAKAFKLHGVHSPFIFNLHQHILLDRKHYEAYPKVEALRQDLLQDGRTVQVTDFGAGSRVLQQRERSIKEIARTSAKPRKYGQLLYRLVRHFQPETIFELGTSLGITTTYLAEAQQNGQVYTFEGCPNIAAIALQNFSKTGLAQIQLLNGNLDETLGKQLKQVEKLDLVYFDGNHRYEPTLRYFNACLTKHHEDSIFVVDDIYWSEEMKKAWQSIKEHPQVRQTVDLYFIGLVFFRTKQPKEHFTLTF